MDLSRATSIEVKPGSETAMDILVPKAQLFKISGHVSGGPNTPSPSAVGISLAFQTLTGGSAFIQMSQVYDPATGLFYVTAWEDYPGVYYTWEQPYEAGKWYSGGSVEAELPPP